MSLIPKGNVASGGSLPWSFASPGSAAPCVLEGGLVLVQNQVRILQLIRTFNSIVIRHICEQGAPESASVGYEEELSQPGNITALRHDPATGALAPTGEHDRLYLATSSLRL